MILLILQTTLAVSGNLECEDKDEGKFEFIKSSIELSDDDNDYESTFDEECSDNSTLIEYYCIDEEGNPVEDSDMDMSYDTSDEKPGEGDIWKKELIDCDDGCGNGVCIDLCAGVTCPSNKVCSNSTILNVSTGGYCSNGDCIYNTEIRECTDGCEDGYCREDVLKKCIATSSSVVVTTILGEDVSTEGYNNGFKITEFDDQLIVSSDYITYSCFNNTLKSKKTPCKAETFPDITSGECIEILPDTLFYESVKYSVSTEGKSVILEKYVEEELKDSEEPEEINETEETEESEEEQEESGFFGRIINWFKGLFLRV